MKIWPRVSSMTVSTSVKPAVNSFELNVILPLVGGMVMLARTGRVSLVKSVVVALLELTTPSKTVYLKVSGPPAVAV